MRALLLSTIVFWASIPIVLAADGPPLDGTKPLTLEGDIASTLVDGVDRFFLKKTAESQANRASYWKRDVSSHAAYVASIEPNRKRLAHILGVRDPRIPFDSPEEVGSLDQPALVGQGAGFEAVAIRWPAFGDVHGEGLILIPKGKAIVADIVAIPDAGQTPEQIAGLVPGVPESSQFARRLAESGCRVVIPTLIDRHVETRMNRSKLSSREFLYRPAFEMGRHLIGYEVQKVLAAVDWFAKDSTSKRKIGVIGWGEGGLIAFHSAALDPRIDAAMVSGYFDRRDDLWTEPIDRNVFGLLEQFGDAEVAGLIAPRALIVEAAKGPEVVVPSGTGAGPGQLGTPDPNSVLAEFKRTQEMVSDIDPAPRFDMIVSGKGDGPYGSEPALSSYLDRLGSSAKLAPLGPLPTTAAKFNSEARQARQFHEIDRHTQQLLLESPYVRQAHFSKLDTSSLDAFQKTVEPYRDEFRNEVIGHFDDKKLEPAPRSRLIFDEPKYRGYEVVLDVFPDVIAYGILLVPKGIKDEEKRPVVVCQHGLEGRPRDVADPSINNPAYNQFAIRLAERGFVTFAPQNLYIFQDRFRTLQRKANPLKKTLFSIIVPQHQQITDWLTTLAFVDPERIAFYGLSYGGKSAMRIPPLVSNYGLSICSADFNEWVWKNASTRSPYSYAASMEYEIFEWDLGSTFNYAEMANLIAPRPFMVERGHFDGVAPDEAVGYEFAKIRFLYEAKLGIGDRCELEWFTGPHTIHGVGTFDFLHKHLKWPKP